MKLLQILLISVVSFYTAATYAFPSQQHDSDQSTDWDAWVSTGANGTDLFANCKSGITGCGNSNAVLDRDEGDDDYLSVAVTMGAETFGSSHNSWFKGDHNWDKHGGGYGCYHSDKCYKSPEPGILALLGIGLIGLSLRKLIKKD